MPCRFGKVFFNVIPACRCTGLFDVLTGFHPAIHPMTAFFQFAIYALTPPKPPDICPCLSTFGAFPAAALSFPLLSLPLLLPLPPLLPAPGRKRRTIGAVVPSGMAPVIHRRCCRLCRFRLNRKP